MSKKITAIVCNVGEHPQERRIDSGLAAMQEVVGGYIAMLSLSDTVDMYFNDEGRLNGMLLNRLVTDSWGNKWDIYGPILLVSHDDEGETVGLSRADTSHWLTELRFAPVNIFANEFQEKVKEMVDEDGIPLSTYTDHGPPPWKR